MENLQTKHHLHAIRLQWLRWLSTPIIAVWNYIVSSLCYVWGVLKMTWSGAKESVNIKYWLVSGAGLSIGVFIFMLSSILAAMTEAEWLIGIGIAALILSCAWINGAVAGLVKYKEDNGTFPEEGIKGLLGNGKKAASFMVYYVFTIAAMIIVQILLSYFGQIPTIGSAFLGIFSLPMVIASAVAILCLLIICFGSNILGAHLLNEKVSEGSQSTFVNTSVSLIKVIGKKWLDIIIASYPAIFLGYLLSFLPSILTGASVGISTSIAAGIAREGQWGLLRAMGGHGGFFDYIGWLFLAITISILAGFVFSFMFSALSCIYYRLYNRDDKTPFIKKLSGFILVAAVPFMFMLLIAGIWDAIYYEFFYTSPSYYRY